MERPTGKEWVLPQTRVEPNDAARFNEALRELKTPRACGDLFAAAIAPFGFDTFASGEVDLDHRERCAFHVIGWPEAWQRFYLQSGLINRDPIVNELRRRTIPFTWTDLRADRLLSKLGTEALDLAAKAGWTEGLIVPMPQSSGRFALVSMAGHRNVTDRDERDYLTLISICFHAYVRTLVGRGGFAVAPAGLTEREVASLKLVALGKSDGAIARELGVAVSTAHEFVEKAKRRLSVHSRAELAALATALGLIDI
jgi:LuxR family transcriptional regulator, quorum-sensing system regulator BjaR1